MVDKKKEFKKEFGGPIGCFLTMTVLPVIFMILIYTTVNLNSEYKKVSYKICTWVCTIELN